MRVSVVVTVVPAVDEGDAVIAAEMPHSVFCMTDLFLKRHHINK